MCNLAKLLSEFYVGVILISSHDNANGDSTIGDSTIDVHITLGCVFVCTYVHLTVSCQVNNTVQRCNNNKIVSSAFWWRQRRRVTAMLKFVHLILSIQRRKE